MGSGGSDGSSIKLSPEVVQKSSLVKETLTDECSSREQDMSEGDQGVEYQS